MTEGEAKNKTQELRLVAIGQRISELKKEGKTFRKKLSVEDCRTHGFMTTTVGHSLSRARLRHQLIVTSLSGIVAWLKDEASQTLIFSRWSLNCPIGLS